MVNELVVRNPQCNLKKEQYNPYKVAELPGGKKNYLWGCWTGGFNGIKGCCTADGDCPAGIETAVSRYETLR
jgi:hypothetical protein